MPHITADRNITKEKKIVAIDNKEFYHVANILKALNRKPFWGKYKDLRTYKWIYIHDIDYWNNCIMKFNYFLTTTTGQLLKILR